ncbi:MAG: TonB-dependent receptor [Chryseolinea sp.]
MKKRIITLLLMALGFSSFAQQSSLSISLSNAKFEEFVTAVERSSPYRFYYQPNTTDSLIITMDVQNKSIDEVLNTVLANTELHFAIDANQKVYVTKRRTILTDLPINYFKDGTSPDNSNEFDYSDYEKKEQKKKLAENRLYVIGKKTSNLQGNATLKGQLRDAATGEPLIGASVFIDKPLIGSSTDPLGYYSLTIPKGRHELKIKSIGMKASTRQVMLYADGKLDIELEEDVSPLKEVVVESDRDRNVSGMQMGVEKLDIKTMKQMPSVLGEVDVFKVMLTLPGVQSAGEGSSGINVRGGSTSQNLILFNDAIVFNPSHLFGFFSTFNPDVLKNVELYKSGINADYGGRLSSVVDVTTREGNKKKFVASGGISPVTGRVTFEGPIIKDRTSFLIGVRSTYSDWILRQLDSKQLQNSTASFYDIHANISHKIDDHNDIYVSGYKSRDKFKLGQDTTYSYSDENASVKWKHSFKSKLFGTFVGTYSKYNYSISSEKNPVEASTFDFQIKQFNGKADLTYILNEKHTMQAGAAVTHYTLSPGSQRPTGSESTFVPNLMPDEKALESALYLSENFEVTPRLSFYAGLRYSFYNYTGPKNVYVYADGLSKTENTIQDTIQYSKGESIKKYHGAEPRFSVRYLLPGNASVKFSYNRMRQYIQMLSNTTSISPTDIWKLSDTYIKPQIGDQVSIGFYKNIHHNSIETSIEAYYKTTQNALDFKNGAKLLLNPHIETDILYARGRSYGFEFLIRKPTGKLNGWISYTYSRSELQTRNSFKTETINSGTYYPSNFDKPHAVNFIGNYKFSRRFNFSLNVTYSTGRPVTIPDAKYDLGGGNRLHYSNRNEYRVPDYFRTDVSINFEGNHKIKKLAHSSWTFAVYNLTGRKNAYSVYFVSQNGQIKGYKLSIFGEAIPTLTYNFKI